MRCGFSLVELSIVLVILGLLTGGILAGQSLIRASELRAVATEYAGFTTAVNGFRDKYFAKPGDFADATKIWGLQVSGSNCTSNSGATVASSPGACDGNGDNIVSWDNAGAVSTAREMHQFWRHLALAGLIEGSYTGLAGSTLNSADVVPGSNSPSSKLKRAGWGAAQRNCGISTGCYTTQYSQSNYPAYFMFGVRPSTGGNTPIDVIMKPEEAWNIDSKIDDGRPAYGKVVAVWRGANWCTTSATNSDGAGEYHLANQSTHCALFFMNAF